MINKFFEDKFSPTAEPDAAAVLNATFREFKVVEGEVPSQYISPSGLNCPMDMAFKLKGIKTDDVKESFQSMQFAVNGTDRHTRIQEFLSTTPFWVDIAQFVKDRGLPLEIVREKEPVVDEEAVTAPVDTGYEVLLVSEQYKTRFRCDGLLLINGEYYVLEIKTERDSVNFNRTGPSEGHYLQGVTYAMLLDVGKIMWVYEGRGCLEQKPFVQLVAEDEKQFVRDYINNIIANVDTPEKLANVGNSKYSSYTNYKKMYLNKIKRKEMEKRWEEQNSAKKQ